MKNRDQLREQYEDALFAMMMGELASLEGEKALAENKRLQDDPAAAVPGQIDRKCMQTIRGHFRKDHMRKAGRTARKALGIAAMVFGIFSALFVGAFAMSETVRINTMNLIVENFKESTDFRYAPSLTNTVPQITAGWVPEGYVLEDEGSDEMSSWFMYKNENEQYIRGLYVYGDSQIMSVDTENAYIINMKIQGEDATIACKEKDIQIAWGKTDGTGFIYLTGYGLSVDDLISVAKNVH